MADTTQFPPKATDLPSFLKGKIEYGKNLSLKIIRNKIEESLKYHYLFLPWPETAQTDFFKTPWLDELNLAQLRNVGTGYTQSENYRAFYQIHHFKLVKQTFKNVKIYDERLCGVQNPGLTPVSGHLLGKIYRINYPLLASLEQQAGSEDKILVKIPIIIYQYAKKYREMMHGEKVHICYCYSFIEKPQAMPRFEKGHIEFCPRINYSINGHSHTFYDTLKEADE